MLRIHSTRAACEAGRVTRRSIGQTSNARMDSLFVCPIDRLWPPLRGAASNASVAPCLCGSILSLLRGFVVSCFRGLHVPQLLRGRSRLLSAFAFYLRASSLVRHKFIQTHPQPYRMVSCAGLLKGSRQSNLIQLIQLQKPVPIGVRFANARRARDHCTVQCRVPRTLAS